MLYWPSPVESNEDVVPQLTAGGFCSAEQGKRAHTPPPCPAPHPRLNTLTQKEALLSGIRARSNPNFQAHPPLESNSGFRLISRWNQTRLSGSFLDWKMLSSTTHRSGRNATRCTRKDSRPGSIGRPPSTATCSYRWRKSQPGKPLLNRNTLHLTIFTAAEMSMSVERL